MNRLQPYQIKQLIFNGEGVCVDFKKTITSCEKIAKTMVSFANNKGGRLLIGVADDKNIKGVKNEEEEKYMIERAATLYAKPMLEPVFEEVYIDDKLVLVVNIAESDMKPHYAYGEDKKWWVYVRVKDKSILASKLVVDVLHQANNATGVLITYTENEKTLFDYLEKNQKITLKEFAILLKISRRNAGKILVPLILSGVIKVNTELNETYYLAV
ncbi:MAG: ATP-binding protein [Cytophagia bacterium]|jgi:predicted HTH transcriptional regulator|nr:MAG: ATP-binding protein [Cytophagia bacterium]